jgi:hypothetical protein
VRARAAVGLAIALATAATAASAAPARPVATGFDCHRAITPAEWRSVLGKPVTVKTGESIQDCLWKAGTRSFTGGISAYPAVYRVWHRLYTSDATGVDRRPSWCMETDHKRTLLHSFGGDFAWSVESRQYNIPGPRAYNCPAVKSLTETSRAVYVIHHGRVLLIRDAAQPGRRAATIAQVIRLAHFAVRHF